MWINHSLLPGVDINIFADGVKMDVGVGAGVFSTLLNITLSISIPVAAAFYKLKMKNCQYFWRSAASLIERNF